MQAHRSDINISLVEQQKKDVINPRNAPASWFWTNFHKFSARSETNVSTLDDIIKLIRFKHDQVKFIYKIIRVIPFIFFLVMFVVFTLFKLWWRVPVLSITLGIVLLIIVLVFEGRPIEIGPKSKDLNILEISASELVGLKNDWNYDSMHECIAVINKLINEMDFILGSDLVKTLIQFNTESEEKLKLIELRRGNKDVNKDEFSMGELEVFFNELAQYEEDRELE